MLATRTHCKTIQMAKPRQLPAPPIVEAVLDVRVNFAATPSMEALGSVAARLPGYVEANRIEQLAYLLAGGGAPPPFPMPPFEVGISYRSADGLYVVQSRRDGISLSRLKPYTDWDPMFEEMWRAWLAYREILRPDRVTRVSTRFINRIDSPAGQDLDEYFLVGPRLPEGAPPFLTNFSSAVGIPFREQKSNAVLRLGMPTAGESTVVAVILDLDILHDCDFAPGDDVALRGAINALRPLKNQLFFGSLTEKAMELFQ